MEKKTDLRIEKTEKAIKNAFIELRAKKPLEKITVKELCELALINKSTFYSHYEDIYALSEAMEQETVESIIGSIDHLKDYTTDNSDAFTRELCLAFMSQISLIKILLPQISGIQKGSGKADPSLLLYTGNLSCISEQSAGRYRNICADDRKYCEVLKTFIVKITSHQSGKAV